MADLVVDTSTLARCASAVREVSGALGATNGFSDDLVLGLGNVDLVVAVRSFVTVPATDGRVWCATSTTWPCP